LNQIENPLSSAEKFYYRAHFRKEDPIIKDSIEVSRIRESILRPPTPKEFKTAFIRKQI
jgi:hypothetical protein